MRTWFLIDLYVQCSLTFIISTRISYYVSSIKKGQVNETQIQLSFVKIYVYTTKWNNNIDVTYFDDS